MPSTLYSIELLGLEGHLVEIEVDKLLGLPSFTIVGLPDAAVKEANERVRSAIKNSDFPFPRNKVVVNLAPADLRKVGPRYDLAIALGILAIEEVLEESHFRQTIIIGELALEGKVRPVTGILASIDAAKRRGIRRALVPAENAGEAALIKEMTIFPVRSLKEAVAYLQEQCCPLPIPCDKSENTPEIGIDMSYIKGQLQAKRAVEVAAAGGHNLLFSGPPGAGKTLLAQAFRGILPSMSEEEMLEVTKIYSVSGLLPKSKSMITERPFRAIHHTASAVSIVGGGAMPAPGEISLAHRGVLFMDEIAEFQPHVLDVLRQPLESQWITVSRARGSFTYPAQFTLVAAMNPCPCGYFNVKQRGKYCICTNHQIRTYQKRLSGPLLDRIDIRLAVEPVEHDELIKETTTENSKTIRKRVERAAQIQRKRFKGKNFNKNASMNNQAIQEYCPLEKEVKKLLQEAVERLNLSARAYFRIIKLARTLADLEASDCIQPHHISEAVQYRGQLFN